MMKDVVCRTCGEIPRAKVRGEDLIVACGCRTALAIAPVDGGVVPDSWAERVD